METRKFNRKEIVRTCCAAIKNKYGIKPPLKSIKLIDFNEDGGYTKFSVNGGNVWTYTHIHYARIRNLYKFPKFKNIGGDLISLPFLCSCGHYGYDHNYIILT